MASLRSPRADCLPTRAAVTAHMTADVLRTWQHIESAIASRRASLRSESPSLRSEPTGDQNATNHRRHKDSI
jgi:hypothetical protein